MTPISSTASARSSTSAGLGRADLAELSAPYQPGRDRHLPRRGHGHATPRWPRRWTCPSTRSRRPLPSPTRPASAACWREAGLDVPACHVVRARSARARTSTEADEGRLAGHPEATLGPGQPLHLPGPRPSRLDRAASGRSARLAPRWSSRATSPTIRPGRPSPYAAYVSVESVVAAGVISHLALTGRFPLAENFRETGFFIPAALGRRRRGGGARLATSAIEALGVTTGCLHTEIKFTPEGPRIIEVNGRVGGGVPEMLERAAGVALLELTLRVALGEAVRDRRTGRHRAHRLPLLPPTAGRLGHGGGDRRHRHGQRPPWRRHDQRAPGTGRRPRLEGRLAQPHHGRRRVGRGLRRAAGGQPSAPPRGDGHLRRREALSDGAAGAGRVRALGRLDGTPAERRAGPARSSTTCPTAPSTPPSASILTCSSAGSRVRDRRGPPLHHGRRSPRERTRGARIAEQYSPLETLYADPPDLLIVTGSNPIERAYPGRALLVRSGRAPLLGARARRVHAAVVPVGPRRRWPSSTASSA